MLPPENNARGSELNENLSVWEQAGYASRSEAMRAAAALWRAFFDAGYFLTAPQAEQIIDYPKHWAMKKFMV